MNLEKLSALKDTDYAKYIMIWLSNENNKSHLNETDFRKCIIRDSLTVIYPVLIFVYLCVFIIGTFGNIGILVVIFRKKLFKNPTYFFVANLALTDVLKAGIILPVALVGMLCKNWIFGSFWCYTGPMAHHFPIHASMLTYVAIAIDRYRLIVYPMKSRLPAGNI